MEGKGNKMTEPTKYKAVTCIKTSEYCPALWEGKLDNGHTFYINFRWGTLNVSMSDDISDNIDDAIGGKTLLHGQIKSNEWIGYLSYDELKEVLKNVLDLPEKEDD